ncbi:hypothetical protein [Streptosporangium sp. LJ11]|uniref:hypothetical protein n=1 Tax=Streptosporangium sp. LJ11 TaxID=3436927 RepID=UPI003F791CEB
MSTVIGDPLRAIGPPLRARRRSRTISQVIVLDPIQAGYGRGTPLRPGTIP